MEFFFFEVNPRRVRDGVVGADLIDESTAPRRALVGDHDAVERMLLAASTGEANGDAHWTPFSCESRSSPPPERPPPSLVSFFIIFFVCAYCLRKRLTSE